jgi:hypothetical protein
VRTKFLWTTITTALVVALTATDRPSAQTSAPITNAGPVHFTAFAVNMSNVGTGTTQTVEIDINTWSSDAERARLLATATQDNQDKLLRALQKTPSHGRMWFPSYQGPNTQARLGYQLHYTHQEPTAEGGRRITFATDRYLSFWEARNRPRSFDYPFTLAQVEVDKDGKGEGKLSVATKISFDKKKNVIELENYASEPVRLQNVKVTPKT